MRDLSFFLRLHALPPLARPSGSLRKPYLPLEVRYIIRPTGEVLLYVSNDLNRKTSYEDLSLFGNYRWNRLFPSTDGAPALLHFHFQCQNFPENFYSCSAVKKIFIGMLCRRGLACHYLPLYAEARWRPLYEYPSQENIVPPQTEQYAFLQPIFFWLLILSVFGVGCLIAYEIATSIINRTFFFD